MPALLLPRGRLGSAPFGIEQQYSLEPMKMKMIEVPPRVLLWTVWFRPERIGIRTLLPSSRRQGSTAEGSLEKGVDRAAGRIREKVPALLRTPLVGRGAVQGDSGTSATFSI